MDPEVTELEARIEERHWWYVGRRRLFRSLLGHAVTARSPRVLDVGSSTGTNLRMCREMGFEHCTGVDVSLPALRHAVAKGLGPVEVADVRALPATTGSFDVVLATDVVEHVEDDYSAVVELARVLAPNGVVLVTAPAFQVLWSRHDEVNHHKRRYRRRQILELLEHAGLHVETSFYFNFLLFVPILLVRRALGLLRVEHRSDTALNIGFTNPALRWIFERDVDLAKRVHPPFGVSVLVLARKPPVNG